MSKTIISRSLFTAALLTFSVSSIAQDNNHPPMATLEACDIIINQKVYRQQDFIFVERDSNYFIGTLLDGKKVIFDLPSMRNTNGIQDMVSRFFWTRNACIKEAIKHVANEDGVSVEIPSTIMLESTRIDKPSDSQ